MNVFIDTNIIIDVLERREPFFILSANLLELGHSGTVNLFATSLSFINGIYVSRKAIGKEEAIKKVRLLRSFINVSPISSLEFDNALDLGIKDIEDALQYCSAISSKCEVIVTRNKKDFPDNNNITIVTPQEFFDTYAKQLI